MLLGLESVGTGDTAVAMGVCEPGVTKDERDFIALLTAVRPEDRAAVLLQVSNAVKNPTAMIV